MPPENDDPPRVGSPLPAAANAWIDPGKLRGYALDLGHASGGHKATVFLRALGIGAEDWEYLRDAILDRLPTHPVTAVREPATAQGHRTYEVLVPVGGLGVKADRTLKVVTGWTISDGGPVLVTTYVAPRSRQ